MEGDEGILSAPRFSVVLAALDDYSIVEQVHLCLEAQTIRAALEIILVCRSRAQLRLPEGFLEEHRDVVILEGGETMLLNEARELGVRSACAPYVLILEDHCLPFPDCLEQLLARLEEGWTAVGPGFESGNTASTVGIAANLLTYGEWMGYQDGEERRFVSGYNSAFSVQALLDRGARLTEDLVTPSTLLMSLASQGHRFYFEPRAVMAHWESSSYAGVREILHKNGCGMGMLRARSWSPGKKAFFSLLNPLLMVHRFLRASRTWWRVDGRSLRVLGHLFPLALLWTFGELVGYWSRVPAVAIEGVSDVEKNRQRFVDAEREPIRKPY